MKNTKKYYNSISSGYNELYGNEQLKKFNLVREYIKGTVLDVGAGTCMISKKIPNFTISLDFSKNLLKQGKGVRILGNGEFLPFKNNSFDTVISLTVLQDTKNPKALVKECERVCKKVLVISCLKRNRSKKWFLSLFKNKGKVFEDDKDFFYVFLK